MRRLSPGFLVGIALLFSCGKDPSGPPVDPGPTASVLSAEFTGDWTPPDTSSNKSTVRISSPAPLTTSWEISASWTECPDADFMDYSLWRSETPGIAEDPSSAILRETFTGVGDSSYVDRWGDWGVTYYYALRTRSTDSLEVWSNEVEVVVDPETAFGGPDELMETVEVGGQPTSIVTWGDRVYVTCYWSDAVYVIEAGISPTVTAVIPVGDGPMDLCSDDNGEYIFVSCTGDGVVDVIQTSDLTVIGEIPVGSLPVGICWTASVLVTVACYGSDRLLVMDPSDYSIVDSVDVGDGPWDVCGPPGSNEIFVANRLDGTVSVVSCSDWSIVATCNVGQQPWVLCADPSGTTVYVGDLSACRVWTIDTATHAVGQGFEVEGGPSGLLALSNGNLLYVSSYYGNRVEVHDPVTLEMLYHFDDGVRPMGLGEDPQGHYVYAANSAVGTVSVYGYE